MNPIDFTKLKVGNYNRKSSESEDRQVLSIQSQIDEAKRIADYYKLSPYVEVYKESKSAKTEGVRPEFSRMMKRIRNKEIDAIACWKADRLARNMAEGGELIDLLSSGTLKAIITHDKVFYPWDNVMVLAIEFSQGKQFVKELSINVKRGQTKKATMGYPHGLATLGFTNDKTEEKGNRKWLVDEVRLPVVKQMLEMFLSGNYSGTQIYDWAINVAKLTTPNHKKCGGNFIAYSRVYTILKDSIYAGFFYQQGQRYELSKELPRLISEDDHKKILRMLSSRKLPKTQTHENPYSGFIESPSGEFVGADMKFQIICQCKHKFAYQNKTNCPKCEIAINDIKNPKYLSYAYYYNVPKRKKRESVKYIEEGKITTFFRLYAEKNLTMSKSLAQWCKRHIKEIKDKEIETGLIESSGNTQRLEQLEGRLTRYRQMLADGQIETSEYDSDVKSIKDEISEIKNPKIKNRDWHQVAEDIVDLTTEIIETLENGLVKDQRAMFTKLGSNLIWNEEILNIINAEPMQKLIDGLNEAKQKNPKFEPENIVDTTEQNEVFEDICPILLRG
ncbi:MAG TPA: recombinase family protein [Candidatus Paceibacterota bacterium]